VKTKYLLILLAISIAIGFYFGDRVARNNFPTTSTETVTDTVFVTIKDSTGITPIPVEVVDNATPVVIDIPDVTTPDPTDTVEVATTKYEGQESLENGTIDYEIYADNLVAFDFKLTTEKEIVTNTITNTVVLPPRSRLYAVVGTDLNFVTKLPTAAEAGLMYIRRNKWGVGVAIRHDFSGLLPPQEATTIGVKVLIGL
jgi:hypothetical protein